MTSGHIEARPLYRLEAISKIGVSKGADTP
jgi:hypothetical protein